MKGRLYRDKHNEWLVETSEQTYQLHPDDVEVLLELEQRFDFIEGRIAASPEVDFNVGAAAGQPFAGANIKRHTRPAPVGNLAAQRDKGLGLAGITDTGLKAIAHVRCAVHATRTVLPAHHMLAQRLGCPPLQRA